MCFITDYSLVLPVHPVLNQAELRVAKMRLTEFIEKKRLVYQPYVLNFGTPCDKQWV